VFARGTSLLSHDSLLLLSLSGHSKEINEIRCEQTPHLFEDFIDRGAPPGRSIASTPGNDTMHQPKFSGHAAQPRMAAFEPRTSNALLASMPAKHIGYEKNLKHIRHLTKKKYMLEF